MFWLTLPLFLIALPFGFYSHTLFLTVLFVIEPIILITLFYFFRINNLSSSKLSHLRNITIAHRGGRPNTQSYLENPTFPENTLPAFNYALSTGAQAFELDIWLTSDGVPVVNHDENVYRHMNGVGVINDLTLRELKKFRYTKHHNSTKEQAMKNTEIYQDITIPTLEEVIVWMKTNNIYCMIEVKERRNKKAMATAIYSLYEKYPFLYERSWVAAFHPMNLRYIRQLSSNIITSYLFTACTTYHMVLNATEMKQKVSPFFQYNFLLRNFLDEFFFKLGTNATAMKYLCGANLCGPQVCSLSEDLITYYRTNNIVVTPWCCNNENQAKYLREQKVTIITDTQCVKA